LNTRVKILIILKLRTMVNYGSKICVRTDSDNTDLPALLSKKLIEDELDV